MSRYVVERKFPEGLPIPAGVEGAALCLEIVERNADEGVTWVHSYVSDDRAMTFCVYDAPSPEAIRKTAVRSIRGVSFSGINPPKRRGGSGAGVPPSVSSTFSGAG